MKEHGVRFRHVITLYHWCERERGSNKSAGNVVVVEVGEEVVHELEDYVQYYATVEGNQGRAFIDF
jgi:hypothetical protein